MASKSHRYEIVISMHNKAELKWHNVNTGVFKAHRNIKSEYKNFWDFYTVFRKKTKEEIEIVYNHNVLRIPAVRLFLKHRPNSKGTGVIANFIFERNGYQISRGINLSNKIILAISDDFISIPEKIYDKAILDNKKALFDYYIEKGHQLREEEIKISDFKTEKIIFQKVMRQGTEPSQDYP